MADAPQRKKRCSNIPRIVFQSAKNDLPLPPRSKLPLLSPWCPRTQMKYPPYRGITGGSHHGSCAITSIYPAQITGEAEVGHVSGYGRGQLGVAIAGNDRVAMLLRVDP